MTPTSQPLPSYPLRLPSYRSLHRIRYHPYPSFHRESGARTFDDPSDHAAGHAVDARHAGPAAAPVPDITEEFASEEDVEHFSVVVGELERSMGTWTAQPRIFADWVVIFAKAMLERSPRAGPSSGPSS